MVSWFWEQTSCQYGEQDNIQTLFTQLGWRLSPTEKRRKGRRQPELMTTQITQAVLWRSQQSHLGEFHNLDRDELHFSISRQKQRLLG